MLFRVIACDVFTREVCWCAARTPHTLDISFTAKGEHNAPATLRALLQAQIDAAAERACRYDAMLLVYGLCGNATVDLTARDCPLVIPRAHDCTTLFLGSKEAFRDHFGANPSQAWTSVGYAERGDAILSDGDTRSFSETGLSFAQLVEQYGEENARYLVTALSAGHDSPEIPFLDVPETHIPAIVARIREHIRARDKTMRPLPGSISLIEKLLLGAWPDDQFLIVPPGARIEGVYDHDQVIKATP